MRKDIKRQSQGKESMRREYILLMMVITITCNAFSFGSDAKAKILYFTHEPGKYHKYTPQKKVFQDIATRVGWDVTYWTGEHDAQIKRLRTNDFGVGYDAIVYNFCFAQSRDLEAAYNLMEQTRTNGVPAILIHCSMHSWWPTFKSNIISDGKGHPKKNLVEKWERDHSGKYFPVWGDFTGVASIKHGHRVPISVTNVNRDHPATKNLGHGYKTGNTELYDNYYILDRVIPLAKGKQVNREGIEEEMVVFWECPQGKSKILGLTLGHDVKEWQSKGFQNMLVDGINYLID